MRNTMQKIISYPLLLLGGIIAGFLLLWGTFLLPLTEDADTVQQSMQRMEEEGLYPNLPYIHSYDEGYYDAGGFMDNFTDSIMVSIAASGRESAFERAVSCYCGYLDFAYGRYWHGYSVLLRPLLMGMDILQIRSLNYLLQLFVLLWLLYLLQKKWGVRYALIFAGVYGLLSPVAVGYALQYSWIWYVTLGGCLYVVTKGDSLKKGMAYTYLFLILGMLTAYVDLLTYPLISFGFPLLVLLLCKTEEKSGLADTKIVFGAGLSWLFGYGGMWAGKWGLGSVLLGRNLFAEGMQQIAYRASGEAGGLFHRVQAIFVNIARFETAEGVCLLLLLLGLCLYWFFSKKGNENVTPDFILSRSLVLLSPFVWYLLVNNHSLLHSGFTYRILGIYVLGMCYLLTDIKRVPGRLAFRVAFVVLLCVLSLWRMSGESTINWMHNEDLAKTHVSVNEQEQISFQLVPDGKMTAFQLAITKRCEEGSLVVRLEDETGVLEQFDVPWEEITDGLHQFVPERALVRDSSYTVTVAPQNGLNIDLALLSEKEKIEVYEQFSFRGEKGYPAGGVVYEERPGLIVCLLKGCEILFAGLWMYLLGGVLFCYFIDKRKG